MKNNLNKSIKADHDSFVNIWRKEKNKSILTEKRIHKNKIVTVLTDEEGGEVRLSTSKKKHKTNIQDLNFRLKRGSYRGWEKWGTLKRQYPKKV